MPELNETRRCSTPHCVGTQTVTEIGNPSIPVPVRSDDPRYGASRYRGHKVWLCDRDPLHITRCEDVFTQIKACPDCGGPMYYTMRLQHRHVDLVARKPTKDYQKEPDPGVRWQCFMDPAHRQFG